MKIIHFMFLFYFMSYENDAFLLWYFIYIYRAYITLHIMFSITIKDKIFAYGSSLTFFPLQVAITV